MRAKDIEKALEIKYSNSLFCVSNIYFFKYPYTETDFLVVNRNGYIYDIEIKVSRSDFKADFKKKSKHSILSKKGFTRDYDTFITENGKLTEYKAGEFIPRNPPNRFYYAVPENLVKIDEIPEYAGLLYIGTGGNVIKVKEAPILTKNKTPYADILASKFYYAYLELKKYNKD